VLIINRVIKYLKDKCWRPEVRKWKTHNLVLILLILNDTFTTLKNT